MLSCFIVVGGSGSIVSLCRMPITLLSQVSLLGLTERSHSQDHNACLKILHELRSEPISVYLFQRKNCC